MLRVIGKWACVRDCGACCFLDPASRAEAAKQCLSEEEFQTYLGLAQEDGWCRHFNKATRQCGIYDTRPRFCRVDKDVFKDLYDVDEVDLDKFCTHCCKQHIGDMYGLKSDEYKRFTRAVGYLQSQPDSQKR
jgi:Fe-S-cluster containining protein